jgi:hypothetical protein
MAADNSCPECGRPPETNSQFCGQACFERARERQQGPRRFFEGTPYPEFRLKALVADIIRSSPDFTGAGQEALRMAESILSFLRDSDGTATAAANGDKRWLTRNTRSVGLVTRRRIRLAKSRYRSPMRAGTQRRRRNAIAAGAHSAETEGLSP